MKNPSITIDPDKLIPDNKQGIISDNGIFYRKGTTLATFDNAKKYQTLIDAGIEEINNPEILTAINDQRFITNMMAVGLYFSFFPEEDWFADEKMEGRMMPALLMLQQYPNRLSPQLKQRLIHLKNKVNPITQALIVETLDFHQQYNNKLEETKKYLTYLFMQYIQNIEKQNFTDIAQLWCDKSDSCFIIPTFDTPIKGKNNIIDSIKRNITNFAPLALEVSDIEVDLDLIKGTAHLYAQQTLKINSEKTFKEKPIPNKAIVNVQFVRLDTPSCQPLLSGFKNWRLGQWKISNWTEVFPYSQL